MHVGERKCATEASERADQDQGATKRHGKGHTPAGFTSLEEQFRQVYGIRSRTANSPKLT